MLIIVRLAILVSMFEGQSTNEREAIRDRDGRLEEVGEQEKEIGNGKKKVCLYIEHGSLKNEMGGRAGTWDWIMFDDFMTIYEDYVYISDLEM